MRLLIVGEERSERAKQLGLTWRDGGLAAKPLFEALRASGVDPTEVEFTNWFERGGPAAVRKALAAGRPVVALGKKVQGALEARRIVHVALVHPAARGKIRKREVYIAHFRERLRGVLGERV